jgi:hypothetical protein
MSNLTALGDISYNGWTASSYVETVGLRGTFQYDSARRTVIYTTWNITIKDRVFAPPGDTTDAAILAIRNQLSVPGGNLTYTNQGIGDLTINSGAKKDVKWGPHPGDFQFKRLGRDQAWEFTWTVETSVPESCVTPIYSGALMALNYEASYSVDMLGYSTRTISGYLEIPMTRASVNSRTMPDDADSYFEKINPSIPSGFRRTGRSRKLSNDKSRLDFSITDDELPPNGYQQGVVLSEVTRSVRPQSALLRNLWINTISGSYTMARNLPRSLSYARFFELMADTVAQTKQFAMDSNGKSTCNGAIPLMQTFEEPVNGKESGRFTFSYQFQCSLDFLIAASGLWRPLPNSDYGRWSVSLGNTMALRGNAGLRHLPSDDAIIDLCIQPPENISSFRTAQQQPQERALRACFPPPSPQNSYMDARYVLELKCDTNVSVMKAIPNAPIVPDENVNHTLDQLLADTGLPDAADFTGLAAPPIPDVVQNRSSQKLSLWLHGYAIRAYYPISPPFIDKIGGQDVVLLKSEFAPEVFGNTGCYPIYRAMFAQKYAIPSNTLKKLTAFANPAMMTASLKTAPPIITNQVLTSQ